MAKPPVVRPPAEYTMGRAMLALNDRQRAFVIAMLELGGQDFTRAATMAGYGRPNSTPAALSVIGHRLAHDDKIQAAMLEEAQKRLGANTILCTSTLVSIISGDLPGCTIKDRTKAIEILLNRTGLHALTEHKVKVEHTTDDEEAMRRIAYLAKRVGIDPSKLLGSVAPAGEVLDAEFTAVNAPHTEEIDSGSSEFDYAP